MVSTNFKCLNLSTDNLNQRCGNLVCHHFIVHCLIPIVSLKTKQPMKMTPFLKIHILYSWAVFDQLVFFFYHSQMLQKQNVRLILFYINRYLLYTAHLNISQIFKKNFQSIWWIIWSLNIWLLINKDDNISMRNKAQKNYLITKLLRDL